ncbi:SagB-type dehydrogenase domain-containing protein [Streptomyces sp. 1222.5]|uniref:SagB family peptide dehydrogenase n=1 Tax=unclassified Streptomyces TaxID=2593676 RepID=UPI00089ADE51|nr:MULTISPECIES: SagB family peptide dehydrogenase [unclassified Streptomyces]PKW09371.1 SagB-type dehydrogenase family enzyme [Streptomyces sp. 5112.2]SEC37035.1 SagB-type dehydrogenase domain-containing protein [Streptomyces sp. 1222.5]
MTITTTDPGTTAATYTGTTRLVRGAAFEDGQLTTRFGTLRLKALPAGAEAALRALTEGDLDEAAISGLVVAGDGEAGLLRWQMLRGRLDAMGLLEHAVTGPDGAPLARLVAVGRGGTTLRPAPRGPARLSRHALLLPADGVLTLRAPGSPLAVELSAGAAEFLTRLTDWTERTPAPLLRLLATAGALNPGGPDADPETGRGAVQWDPVDLAFHARTRTPAAAPGYGGTYPHADRFPPEPAAAPAGGGPAVPLPVPDLDAIAAREPSLTEVLEGRTSTRAHDPEAPLTLAQLGELLYRTVRIRSTFTGSDGQELADRPMPSGGSVHELEVYPLVTNCAGLEPGLYRYAPDRHELQPVAAPGPATVPLVKEARDAAMMTGDPQVVLLVAARFGRVMWKYETVAYPLILKHVGVLYQTVYLVATAMGLAVCGLGGGDTTAFAAATGRDPLLEGSVGELVLGSRPPAQPEPSAVAGD